eukprot:Selendium_serpulae@DN5930_c0_g2_i2.p1
MLWTLGIEAISIFYWVSMNETYWARLPVNRHLLSIYFSGNTPKLLVGTVALLCASVILFQHYILYDGTGSFIKMNDTGSIMVGSLDSEARTSTRALLIVERRTVS